ncbi:MAG: hypothetical protein FJ197_10505 [Gammaproteobacteria bacterium]|nr:hypothetical protein [Gammaproteobacteria bacterium]
MKILTLVVIAASFLAPVAADAGSVGRIAGEFGTTATGGAGYTIPIQVAAGMNGLRPDIALQYSSQAGDGFAGIGWSPTGFSEISRCGRTLALDGYISGVHFSSTDRFCLDGQPLILVAGTHARDGAEYRLQIHQFERIVARGAQGSGPAWFEMYLPSGLIQRFGNDDDSRVEASGTTEVRSWAINEIEDKYQQRIGFRYSENTAEGEHLPTEIRWTYGPAEAFESAPYRLVFETEPRPAQEFREGWLSGTRWRSTRRLAAISYEYDAGTGFQRVHRYALSYSNAVNAYSRSRLQAITQCGPTDCLPATRFEWDADAELQYVEMPTLPRGADLYVDVNGDGAADAIDKDAPGMLWLRNPNSDQFLAGATIYPALPAGALIEPLDYNGDGRMDFLVSSETSSYWSIYEGGAAQANTFVLRSTAVRRTGKTNVEAMDVNGDGYDDIVFIKDGGVHWSRNNGGSLAPAQDTGIAAIVLPPSGGPSTTHSGSIQSGDFDGDGREDIMVARPEVYGEAPVRWYIHLSNGNGFEPTWYGRPFYRETGMNPMMLDANGDGLTDLLLIGDFGQIRTQISRGKYTPEAGGFVNVECPTPFGANSNFIKFPADMDGDGRTELIVETPGQPDRLLHATDNCFVYEQYEETLHGGLGALNVSEIPPSADFNGDGRSDLHAFLGTWNSGTHFVLTRRAGADPDGTRRLSRGDQVGRITDGLGNVHDIRYRALTGWSQFTPAATNSGTTRRLLGGPVTVVSDYDAPTGRGGERFTVSFRYSSARIDVTGRNQLTFDSIRATDSRTGFVTETLYSNRFPYAGRVELRNVWNGNARVSAFDPVWAESRMSVADPARYTYFIYPASETTTQFELSGTTGVAGSVVRTMARVLTWNLQHGAIATDQTTVQSPLQTGATYRSTRQTTFDDAARTAGGCLGLPTRIDVIAEASGITAPARTTLLSYDPTTCRPLSQTSGETGSASRQLRTSWTYDASGRVVTETRADAAGSLTPRVTVYAYGSSRFRPTSETRRIPGEPDYFALRSWDEGLGLPLTATNPQGNVTSWTLDEFGRQWSEVRPRGNTFTTYATCGACFAPQARFVIRRERSDGFWTESQHDSLGRVVGSASVLPDGRTSRQVTEFDAHGRVSRQSIPYVEGATSIFWNSYAYDNLGRIRSITRPASETAPAGAVTLVTHAGFESTVRDPESRTTTYVHDAAGQLVAVRGPLGSGATYSYDPFGQLTAITDAAGHTRQFIYDGRGLLVRTEDPDAGRRTHDYNAFGELVSTQDGKTPANVATMQYDALGRLTARIEPEGTTNWTYSATAGPSRGLLLQVTGPTDASPTGFRETYAYGPVSRVRQTSTTIDGQSYVTDVTYDAEGKIATMLYPTTVGWRPKFVMSYSLGHLVGISQENPAASPVYTLLSMDALGRDVAARFGSGVVEERTTHDPASGLLTAISSGLGSGRSDIQDLRYQWDKAGNLTLREDLRSTPQLQERFAYDAVNRLSQVTLNGAITLSMSYGTDGNVLSKSDVGTFTYGSAAQGPHAVASLSGGPRPAASYAYDANGNMTAGAGRNLNWTSFDLPRQITQGTDYARFSYGPQRGRIRQELRVGNATRTIHYVGPHFEVEMEGSIRRYRSNVFAYGRAVFTQVESTPNGLDAYYVLHDHAGSVDRLVRAVGTGVDQQKLAFDAWGKRRNLNWSADQTDSRYADDHLTERGFTGHEHLDGVRLVHMNGRLQDPLTGRMLSPDPVISNLLDPESLNPYSYVANNPASNVDPSGYFLKRIGKFVRRLVSGIGSFTRRLFDNYGREILAVVGSYYAADFATNWTSRNGFGGEKIQFSFGTPIIDSNGAIIPGSTLTAAVPAPLFIGSLVGGAVAGGISSGSLRGATAGALGGGIAGGVSGFYGGSYSAGRVVTEAWLGGGSAAAQGGSFDSGAAVSGGVSALTWASLSMRRAMIEQSRIGHHDAEDPLNKSDPTANSRGVSVGFLGDFFKLGGCRFPCKGSPLGGIQGGTGNVFGLRYSAGSFFDRLVEAYSGPHDFLNSPLFYDAAGNNAPRPFGLEVVNAANVFVATPFVLASVIPPYATGIPGY